jgi:hypothetical protein
VAHGRWPPWVGGGRRMPRPDGRPHWPSTALGGGRPGSGTDPIGRPQPRAADGVG